MGDGSDEAVSAPVRPPPRGLGAAAARLVAAGLAEACGAGVWRAAGRGILLRQQALCRGLELLDDLGYELLAAPLRPSPATLARLAKLGLRPSGLRPRRVRKKHASAEAEAEEEAAAAAAEEEEEVAAAAKRRRTGYHRRPCCHRTDWMSFWAWLSWVRPSSPPSSGRPS